MTFPVRNVTIGPTINHGASRASKPEVIRTGRRPKVHFEMDRVFGRLFCSVGVPSGQEPIYFRSIVVDK